MRQELESPTPGGLGKIYGCKNNLRFYCHNVTIRRNLQIFKMLRRDNKPRCNVTTVTMGCRRDNGRDGR